MKRASCLLGFLAAGCAVHVGSNQPQQQPGQVPPGYQQPIPPPQAYQQNQPYAYYAPNSPPPQVRPPAMPPALSIRDVMNVQHLQRVASSPRACNIPLEVSPGNFVHLDCFPYKRVSLAQVHATPAKLKMMSAGNFKWNPLAALGVQLPQQPGAVRADTPSTYPDMVDHRLNGQEGPIKDQGDVGACTSFALSSVFDNSLRRASQNITTSPEHLWSHYAVPTMEDAASSNLNKPITTHEALPYSGKEACQLMKDSTDDCGAAYNVRPNSAASDPALQAKLRTADASNGHKIIAFEELQVQPPNIDEIVAVLASGADIWAAFNIDSSSFVNRRMTNFVIPDWVFVDGGHALAISGYRKVNGQYQFLLHNSWGVSWGDQGYAWVSQAMVTRWLHLAYKVKTDVDPGGGTPVVPKTDEDCRGDQVIDSVTKLCAGACPDGQHPANGQCSNGPAPGPQQLNIPGLGGLSIPTIPGWNPNPQPQPQPGPNPQPQPNQPTQPSTWPWPVPSNLPPIFQPPPPK
ncbi:MAG: C1 family peptidase [Labilithrix sp.]